MNEQDKTATPSQPGEAPIRKKEEPNPTPPGKRGRKTGGGADKAKKNNAGFLAIKTS